MTRALLDKEDYVGGGHVFHVWPGSMHVIDLDCQGLFRGYRPMVVTS